MKNIAAVFAADISQYALSGRAGGSSAFEEVLSFAGNLPDVEKVVVFTRPSVALDPVAGYTAISHDEWTVSSLVSRLAELAEDFDQLFYMFGDTPLLDLSKSGEMYENHVRYYAQYSFADGYPLGLIPEIIKCDVLGMLATLAQEMAGPVGRGTIFEVVQKDINAFDIETDIAAVDRRLLRVTLAADTLRNTTLLESVSAANPDTLEDVCLYLDNNPRVLRTLPAYVLVQVEEGCPQACTYCPWPVASGNVLTQRGEMALEDFRTIVEKVSDFSGDATIALSLWGEPALHSRIADLAAQVEKFDRISLLIETSGVGWREGDVDAILAKVGDKTRWIVSLDTENRDVYRRLRGDGLEAARDFALKLIEKAPNTTHVQAVRMKESEEHLQGFYRFWKQHTENIIIQKYDTYCGFLPPRKVTDLSPLNRFPCWHLKRDLHILLDGSVPVCREDIKGGNILGNILNDDVATIWERGEEWYARHIDEDYPELCRECDEYYTYNF